jgi:sulfur carrier protein ThiS
MKVTVKISRTKETKTIELNNGSLVQDVLKKINMKPDTLIVMNKSNPIPIDTELNGGEELTIIQVSSGG